MKTTRLHWLSVLYWLTPPILFAIQLRFSTAAMTQLRYEEEAESIRSVYWFDLHSVFDGIYANAGYYGLLLLTYKAFGFSLYMAKYVRAGLHLISLLCLAEVLRRKMGMTRGIVPLAAFGLSPTLLYFNAIQASFGIDLQFFPICLLILTIHRLKADFAGCGLSLLLGAVGMIAWMSYPTFICYLPALAAIGLIEIDRQRVERPIAPWNLAVHAVCAILGFAAPLVAALLWVDHPGILLDDPVSHSGIFRGGGGTVTALSAGPFIAAVKIVLQDLLIAGRSYNFELARAEFAGLPARLALICVLSSSILAFLRVRELRLALAIAWGMIALSLLLPSLGRGIPGLRRCTGMLAGFYALYAIVWQRLTMMNLRSSIAAWIGIACCLLLPLHSLAAIKSNRESAAQRSLYADELWFSTNASPEQTIDYFLKQTENGAPLLLLGKENEIVVSGYLRVYPVLAGWRRWNKLPEIPIYGFDPKTGYPIRLEPRLWDAYYWPHYTDPPKETAQR